MKKNNTSKKSVSYKVGRPKKQSTVKDKVKMYKTQITDYDFNETTDFIDPKKSLRLSDLGLTLPETPPTQVVSIRLPSQLLNQIRALSSDRDISYQSLIKILLAQGVKNFK